MTRAKSGITQNLDSKQGEALCVDVFRGVNYRADIFSVLLEYFVTSQ